MENNFYKVLESKGIRPSVQRSLVYEYVRTHKTHPTVDEIYSELSPSYPTLSRTTVYNTLKLFAQNGLVQVVKIESDELRYDSEMMPHVHFKCSSCGKIYDIFPENHLFEFNEYCKSHLPDGFKLDEIQTNLWGMCALCEKNAASEN